MLSITILVVEDELKLLKLTEKYLLREGFRVHTATNGKDALSFFSNNEYDLIIMDLMLPDISGYKISQKIRECSDVPIIMLTARSEIQDKLDGFKFGADDYITKPFSPKELIARIKVILRRNKKILSEDIYIHGNFTLNTTTVNAYINDQPIDLTPGEFELLYYLALNKHTTLSRNQILERIWGFDYDGDARAVDTRIKRLRKKLSSADISINTIRGIGYRLEERNEV